eukprot:13549_1
MALLATTLFVLRINANPCIRSYPGHTIEYITTDIATDSSIYYLGKKASTNECHLSCMNLNYLCDTSAADVISPSDVQVDLDTCQITASLVPQDENAILYLTDDLVSKEYVIEAHVTLTESNGCEVGIYWKASDASTPSNDIDYVAYSFGVDLCDGKRFVVVSESSGSTSFIETKKPSGITVESNRKYNLTLHVDGTQFTTYVDGQLYYASSDANHQIDETVFKWSYAGLYAWTQGAVWHSWTMRFPDPTDNKDEKVCAAYMYDKSGGSCYGYYGDDYTSIESSLAPDTQHDSAVLYHYTCDPTASPSSDPTTRIPSDPTRTPSQTPILTSNQTPTPSQSPILTSDPTRTPSQTPILTSNQTPTPSQSLHSSYPSDMPSVNSTPRPTRQQDGQVDDESTTEYSDSKSQDKDQIMSFEWNESVVIAVIFSMVLFVIVVVLVCVLYRIRHNQADAKKIVDVIKETFEEDDVNGDNTHGIQTQSGLAVKDDDDVIKPRNMHGEGEENTNAYDHEGDSPIAIVMETKGEHRQTVPPPLPPRVLHEDFANVAQSAPNVDPVCFVNAAHLDDEIVDPDEDNNGLMTTGGIGTVQ